jgi:hypothetical protein
MNRQSIISIEAFLRGRGLLYAHKFTDYTLINRNDAEQGNIRYASIRDLRTSTTLHFPHSTPTAIMPKSCIVCSAVASPEIMLQYCAACQSALYCSRACQRIDWKKKQHKQICKRLNVGHGDCQIRTDAHINRSIDWKEEFARGESCLDERMKRFFKLFEESTFEGSQAAAQKMKKYAKRQTKHNQHFLLFHSLDFLARSSNSRMLSWPNSPLLVMLQCFDSSVPLGEKDNFTPLHQLADVADPFDYSTHENQLILAKQLIEHGANINAASTPHSLTPLHKACFSGVVTNLDFIEYLLEAGANPNAQDFQGMTPLLQTTPYSPSAAKFLLNWPTTNANIPTRDGVSFLVGVRELILIFSHQIKDPRNPDKIQEEFLLKQWREIEEMLVERGAAATGIVQRAPSTNSYSVLTTFLAQLDRLSAIESSK